MRETNSLEFKEEISNTFLKTVSAFANYGTGRILFGVTDKGVVKGLTNPAEACLELENRINDSIDPVPEFALSLNNKTSVVTLTVFEGLHKPYLYHAKAYRRNDSSTVPVDRLELTRLILEGRNLSFEELPAKHQDLSFNTLGQKLSTELKIKQLNQDTLKSLELYSDQGGFNKAGELLSDANPFPGIDMVRFGDNLNIILDRESFEHESVLQQFDHAVAVYSKYYQYEQIEGVLRNSVSLIPQAAFRETLANAIVHRSWDLNARIQISMYADRIEVVSPGGLPRGISEDDFRRGGLSVLRNRILGNVFLRLQLIERFGTGIRRINETYLNSGQKPVFRLTDNTLRVVLPVLQPEYRLTEDENKVFKILKNRELSSSAIAENIGFSKSKVIILLKKLVAKGYVNTSGQGRGTRYTRE